MKPLAMLLAVIFAISAAVGIVFWFLYFVEYFRAGRFISSEFFRGPLVVNRELQLPSPGSRFSAGQVLETRSARVFVESAHRWFFVPRQFTAWEFDRRQPIKGVLVWHDHLASVQGRAPRFQFLFIYAWLAGWIAGGTLSILAEGLESEFIELFMVSLPLVAVGIAYFRHLAQVHVERIIHELTDVLSVNAA